MKLWFHIAILNDLGVDGALPQARLILVEHDGHGFQFRLKIEVNILNNQLSLRREHDHEKQQRVAAVPTKKTT